MNDSHPDLLAAREERAVELCEQLLAQEQAARALTAQVEADATRAQALQAQLLAARSPTLLERIRAWWKK